MITRTVRHSRIVRKPTIMKRTLNIFLLLLLTTTSAIADVNFTEKTPFYYSDFNETDVSVVTPIYLNYTDANGITLSSSNNALKAGSKPTETEFKEGRWWYDTSCSTGNISYNTNYFQVSSASHAIKQLSVRLGAAKVQVVIVGWKGTVNGNADYYRTGTYDKITTSEYRWIEYNLSEWEDVRTIRLYYCFNSNSDLKVNNKKVEYKGSGTYKTPDIYGIQVGIGSTTTSISSYGVAAFSSGNYLDFTNVTECSAFYADSYANGVLHLTKATGVVPPNFGLLLSSTNGGATSFSIPIATAEQQADCTLTTKSNKFVATDQATYTPTTSTEALALGVKNGKAGFYYVGANVTVPQYRFYLPAPSVGGAKNLTLDFDNATGITSIPFNDPATQNSVGESAIPSQTSRPTDLLGRPCPTPRAGALYIKGGKAYLTPAR